MTTTDRTPTRVLTTALAALVATGLAILALGALTRSLWDRVAAPGPSSLDEVVAALAAATALALAVWLGLGLVIGVLGHLPGRVGALARAASGRWTPVVTQRLAAVLVGAVVGAVAAPASAVGDSVVPAPGFSASAAASSTPSATATTAMPLPPAGPGFTSTAPTSAPTSAATTGPTSEPTSEPTPAATSPVAPTSDIAPPGWTPTRPLVRPQPSPELVTGRVADGAEEGSVVVRRGDSLWAIAARHLDAGASDAEIARAWPRWYAANRDVIGDDPHLLHPGMVLQVPGSRTAVTR
ncbi:LysM peptidoglycan-binding domain-containing protein [Knoellia koreensis]|uniref:LysM peptidoglycan-binding domain-containing protein n=1 Tax=Knoellia koreensis TaxID=2730921 RepID=A0A849HGK0_9MICO|nr:LysM peptidoglycan-binding domain-containing protein [Knoellia sp. DB2414S]NNM46319.1 LysM peptidoglycan-binding domain-containing protein [Knoellia sp. DB2414S]